MNKAIGDSRRTKV